MIKSLIRMFLRFALAAWMMLSLLRYSIIIVIKRARYGDQSAYVLEKRRIAKAPMDMGHAWQALQHVLQFAESCGARVFPISGTLLGIHRHGGLLPHDNDMDLGIQSDDPTLGELVRLLKKSQNLVEYKADRLSWADRLLNPWLPQLPDNVLIHKFDLKMDEAEKPVRIDLFVHFDALGQVVHGTTKSLWANSPFALETTQIRGVNLLLPADRGKYLAENYGDYETPKPQFESFVDCPNCINIQSFKAAVPIAKKWALFHRTRDETRQRLIGRRISEFWCISLGKL